MADYRTKKIHIKENQKIAQWFLELMLISNELYNRCLFINRQTFSGLQRVQRNEALHPNQQNVYNDIHLVESQYITTELALRTRNIEKVRNKKTGETIRKSGGGKVDFHTEKKKRKKCAIEGYKLLDDSQWYLNSAKMKILLATLDDKLYRSFPSQSAQAIVEKADEAWKSFFELKELSNSNSLDFIPSIPQYRKNRQCFPVTFRKEALKIIHQINSDTGLEEILLRFSNPGIKNDSLLAEKALLFNEEYYYINVSNFIDDLSDINQITVVKEGNGCCLHIEYQIDVANNMKDIHNHRWAGGDIGVSNLLTIVTNVEGVSPIIIDGRELKSINQYWSKINAKTYSEYAQYNGNDYQSKAIKHNWFKRKVQLEAGLHRAAKVAANWLQEHDISLFVVGKTDGWKQRISKKRKSKTAEQDAFIEISHCKFIEYLSYECKERGIHFVTREESFTSQASLINNDWMPDYDNLTDSDMKKWKPTGSRTKRGKYVSYINGQKVRFSKQKNKMVTTGIVLNSDVNAAGNILRKEKPEAFKHISNYSYLQNVKRLKLGLPKFSGKIKQSNKALCKREC